MGIGDGPTETSPPEAGQSLPGSVRWLTAALAVAGVTAAVGANWVRAPDAAPGLPAPAVAALLVFLAVAGCLQLQFSFRDQVEAINLFDAVLAPMVFFLPAPLVVALAAAGEVACGVKMHTQAVKAWFNAAQWVAASGAGVLCYALLAEGSEPTARNLVALGVAMATVAVVNHLAMLTVFALVTPGPLSGVLSGLSPLIGSGWILNGAINLAFGLLVIAALHTGAWTVVLFAVPLGMLHWANRGYAEGRADRARLGGLQRATHTLVGPIDPRDAIGDFLVEVRDCFAVEVAELVLLEPGGGFRIERLRRADPSGVRSWTMPVDSDALSCILLRAGAPVRVGPNHPDEAIRERLQAEGWRDCLAAPLVSKGAPHGILCIYNRTGLEGFETGEMAVLEALARELNGALEKALLVEEVLHQALHDALTGLPNRTLFHQRVQRAIAAARATGGRVAVMLIDLNRFKEVNDTLGHHNGDLLLQDFSRRIQHSLRPGDTVARLGGDEFAIVISRVSDVAEAERVVTRVLRALDDPFLLHELTLDVDAAVGIALYPDHGTDAATLLQRADVAMYGAKGTLSGYEVYRPENDRYSPRRLALVGELRSAASNGQLHVHYQPKCDLRTGRITGLEALLRWDHPVHGRVPPDEFIPIAEHTGSIRPLTTFVMEEAVTQCAAWRAGGLDIGIAVNLSVRSLLDTDLPEEINRLLRDTGVPPDCVTLELTESSVMSDALRTAEVLERLHHLGVRLSIDDYGTGYSSLSYLRSLPVSEMKIDKSFVMHMATDDNDAVIVRSTVDLAHNLGLRVVAEGVEDEESWRRLVALGCDSAQGYFLSRPVPASEVVPMINRLQVESLTWAPGATSPG